MTPRINEGRFFKVVLLKQTAGRASRKSRHANIRHQQQAGRRSQHPWRGVDQGSHRGGISSHAAFEKEVERRLAFNLRRVMRI
jgi:hypothetical protein